MTGLSVGRWVNETLKEALGERVTNVYAVYNEKAVCPYVVYRRAGMQTTATRAGLAKRAEVEVVCVSKKYGESVAIAERVSEAMDMVRGESEGITVRLSQLTNAEEGYDGDAYLQTLTFAIDC